MVPIKTYGGIGIHSNILAWEIPWTEEPGSEAPCGPILGTQQHAHRMSVFTYVQAYAHYTPPSLGFSRQEHWSGLPFPSPVYESEK